MSRDTYAVSDAMGKRVHLRLAEIAATCGGCNFSALLDALAPENPNSPHRMAALWIQWARDQHDSALSNRDYSTVTKLRTSPVFLALTCAADAVSELGGLRRSTRSFAHAMDNLFHSADCSPWEDNDATA